MAQDKLVSRTALTQLLRGCLEEDAAFVFCFCVRLDQEKTVLSNLKLLGLLSGFARRHA